MKNNKKILTIVIVVILLLVGALAGVAYAYFYTDVFKSDKQKFFKYMSRNIENVSSLKSEELTKYIEKKKTQAYDNNGEFYTTVDEKTASSYMPSKKVYDEVEKFKVTFQGQKDIANNYMHDTVNLQYSNGEKMTFEIARQDDYYGIKVDTILKKFLAIENNNLKDFAKNLGVQDTSTIPDKIEMKNYDKYKFTDEELKIIKTKLYQIVDENLQETMFREEKNDSYAKYTLTLTIGQVEDIFSKIYKALVNDETVTGKIKEVLVQELEMTEQEAQEKINELKEAADRSLENVKEEKDETIETDLISINVYKDKANKGNIPSIEIISKENRISLGISENRLTFKFDEGTKDGETIVYNPFLSAIIEKITESQDIAYAIDVSISNNFMNIDLNEKINFAGILSGQDSVKEEVTFGAKIGNNEGNISQMQYTYLNNVKFNSDIAKEDMKSNSIKINNYNAEKLQTTFDKLTSLIDTLNKKQMQSLGLEANQNPILYMTPLITYLRFPFSVHSDAQNAINTANLSEQEMMMFNNKFIPYEGNEITGIRVNSLIQQVLATNTMLKNDDTRNIEEIALYIDSREYKEGNSAVETTKKYKVELKYKNGYVNQINVTTNLD